MKDQIDAVQGDLDHKLWANEHRDPLPAGLTLEQLIAADRKRGLATSVRFLDDARSMRGRRAPAVTDPEDYASTKATMSSLGPRPCSCS